MPMIQTHIVYTLTDPRDGQVRYVGCCLRRREKVRLGRHISCQDGNKIKNDWVRELTGLGLEPVMSVVERAAGIDWESREQHWVAYYAEAGNKLLNMTKGGKGSLGLLKSEETKRKHQSQRHTEEAKRKISERFFGVPKSLYHRQRMSLAKKGVPLTEAQKSAIAKAIASNPQCMARYTKGEANGRAVLTESTVREIRRMKGEHTAKELAKIYGVAECAIKRVWQRRSWGHVV